MKLLVYFTYLGLEVAHHSLTEPYFVTTFSAVSFCWAKAKQFDFAGLCTTSKVKVRTAVTSQQPEELMNANVSGQGFDLCMDREISQE